MIPQLAKWFAAGADGGKTHSLTAATIAYIVFEMLAGREPRIEVIAGLLAAQQSTLHLAVKKNGKKEA